MKRDERIQDRILKMRIKYAKNILKEYDITEQSTHHSNEYMYNTFIKLIIEHSITPIDKEVDLHIMIIDIIHMILNKFMGWYNTEYSEIIKKSDIYDFVHDIFNNPSKIDLRMLEEMIDNQLKKDFDF